MKIEQINDSNIRSIISMIDYQEHEVRQRKAKVDELKNELFQIIKEATGLHIPCYDISPWGWDCLDSPIRTCVYDGETDPCMDNCIYCHEPMERK